MTRPDAELYEMFNMPVTRRARTERRAVKKGAGRRRTAIIIVGSALGAAALGWSAAFAATGTFPRVLRLPPSIMAVSTAGLAGYTMLFLLGEAALLVLAVINIRDEKLHNRYKSLMLHVLYVVTFRYRRVLPGKFFAESGAEHPVAAGAAPRHATGKHRRQKPQVATTPKTRLSPPATEEEVRTAFALLITRMATVLDDVEIDRTIVDTALRHVLDSAKAQEAAPAKTDAPTRPLE
jgi:hypothetical protein